MRKRSEDVTEIDAAMNAIKEIRSRLHILDKELASLCNLTGIVRASMSDVSLAMTDDAESVATDVADVFKVPVALMFSTCRQEPVAHARFCTWAILRQRGYTMQQIGDAFKRDHSAVVHGVRRAGVMHYMGRVATERLTALSAKGYTLTVSNE